MSDESEFVFRPEGVRLSADEALRPYATSSITRYVAMYKTVTGSDDSLADTYKLPYLLAIFAAADHVADALRTPAQGSRDLKDAASTAMELLDKVAEMEQRIP